MSGRLRRIVGGAAAVLLAAGVHAATLGPTSLRSLPAAAVPAGPGYWLLAADGGVFSFGGNAFYGPNRNTGPDIVAGASTPGAAGYWMVDDDGDVFNYGDAANFGSRTYNADDVVGFAARRQGDGYWIVASGGGIFAFGDAPFHGSTGAIRLNKPIVGMAATATGNGYWLVASDGGIFAFGDATFHGSTGAVALVEPIVGIMAVPPVKPPVLQPPAIPPPPDARPVARADRVTLDEDTSVTVNVLGNDTGLEDGGLAVSIDRSPLNGTATVTPDQQVIYTPAPDYFGTDSFTYVVIDADGYTAGATVSLTVNPRPDPPRITPIAAQLIDEDASTGPLPFTIQDPDSPGLLTVTARSSDAILVPGAGLTLSGGGPVRTVTVTPAPDASGSAMVTLTVSDTTGATSSTSFAVVVSPVDDQPVAIDDTGATDEDEPVTIDVAVNDIGQGDGGIMVMLVAATLDPGVEGAATVSGIAITFAPAPNRNGPATFDYIVSDADGDTSQATVTIDVAPVNDAPVITPIANLIAVPGVVSQTTVTVADADDLPAALEVEATSPDQSVQNLIVDGLGAVRTLSFFLDPGATGTATITVTVTDQGGETDSTAFTVTASVAP